MARAGLRSKKAKSQPLRYKLMASEYSVCNGLTMFTDERLHESARRYVAPKGSVPRQPRRIRPQ
jgi:hypothetical protein